MKKSILLFACIFILKNSCHAQKLRKPINISNDFYTIKISEATGKVDGTMVTMEKNGKDYFKIQNANFKTILERVFPNTTLKFLDNKYSNEPLNVDLLFQGMSLEEFQPLFIQQISTYFPIKIENSKYLSEKWNLRKQDSKKLSTKIYTVKSMDVLEKQYKSLETIDGSGIWKIENVTLDEFVNKLSKFIRIPIENNIESESVYAFELKMIKPVDYEDIKKQLEGFGFQIITEHYNNKLIQISSTK